MYIDDCRNKMVIPQDMLINNKFIISIIFDNYCSNNILIMRYKKVTKFTIITDPVSISKNHWISIVLFILRINKVIVFHIISQKCLTFEYILSRCTYSLYINIKQHLCYWIIINCFKKFYYHKIKIKIQNINMKEPKKY